jgi:hypothetical protein
VSFEALFLLVYANGLLLAALGLHRLGRVDPSPWRSRVLAGHRRHHPDTSPTPPAAPDTAGGPAHRLAPGGSPNTWPHAEQPRLHTGIALVAVTAALVLTIAGLWRHHHDLDLTLLTATAAAACAVLARLSHTFRRADQSTRPDTALTATRSRSPGRGGRVERPPRIHARVRGERPAHRRPGGR